MEITTFSERTRALRVPFGEQALTLTYYPNRLSLVDVLDPANQTAAGLAPGLAALLKDWDAEINGVPVPITAEAIGTLPARFVTLVQQAINEDMRPGEATGSN